MKRTIRNTDRISSDKTTFRMSFKTPFNIQIESNSLVVIGGRPGMGIAALGISLILNAEENQKGHFISLHNAPEVLALEFPEIDKVCNSFVEQPTTLQLLEHIVKINSESCPDYFVIDSLDYIGKEKPLFLNKNKKYQKQLRHLRVLARAMNKPIFLLATLDQSIEESGPTEYHRIAHREKHVDYIFILYRWKYYDEPFITEDGTWLEENEALLITGKSPTEKYTNYTVLNHDPKKRLLKIK